MKFEILDQEYWWAGCIHEGYSMPYSKTSEAEFTLLTGKIENDEYAPLMVSTKGRYVWSENWFDGRVSGGVIELTGPAEITLYEGYGDLKGAYLAAMKAHFPFTGVLPDERFFRIPQYNTWIELGTEQTTENILRYAHGIIDHGLPAGIMMIDGGWQEDYGVYDEFNRRKVPDPKYLTDELHRLGFAVMVWASPIVSSAGPRYKFLRDKGYLIRSADGEIAVRRWWSGFSAVLDFSNPEAVAWMYASLDSLMERFGVDGFKFDAGDAYFYLDDDQTFGHVDAREQTARFNEMGERYSLNEFRAAWKFGGRPIVARLHDKMHNWNVKQGFDTLIPNTIAQGLAGYAYCCPDMVGGGELYSFVPGGMDEELFVRWAQANALMGMMQMSAAPWRVLKPENAERVKAALMLHARFGEEILGFAKESAKTGEPITRALCYEFPGEGFEEVKDAFMLSSKYLVAPVITQGAVTKTVRLPRGSWRYIDGTVYEGSQTITVDVDLDTLPYFERI